MNVKKAILIIEQTIAPEQLFTRIKGVTLVHLLPEAIVFALMASGGVQSAEFIEICWLFVVSAFLLRLIWNIAIVVHGLGHVLCIAILDQDLAAITVTNILENRKISQICISLIPFSSILIPCVENSTLPWVTPGKSNPHRLRIKALGGPFFNLVALLYSILTA